MAIRTCREFEPEWLDLLGKIHEGFLILPVGFLSPSFHGDVESEAWGRIAAWLDRKEPGSVLFAAFGSEVKFTTEQIEEIASGLENSGVPFVWALREGSPPDWFPERIGERDCGGGMGAAGLTAGVALVVLPMQFEQGLNARNLWEKGLGVEVFRDREDGSFTGEEIARKLRMVMLEEEGEGLKARARAWMEKFGSEEVQDRYVEDLAVFMWENKLRQDA
ncbi:hypothetical protein HPP92_013301 [Vanilla planifolia]|uniref:Uncharacterized protein n=1 Tax=Vanilla planifolia TaxID=51239 RepID=A0A835UYC2_VANPL|nr:hypothetical protein HPP92_013301 [Vanilla planifolia]